MHCFRLFCVAFFLGFAAHAQDEMSIYGRGWDGQMIEVEGVVGDSPKLQVEKGGKTRSYNFRLFSSEDHKRGDEYVEVVYYVTRGGKKVGVFSAIKGDKVTIKGRYSETKDVRKNGKIGSITVH